MRRELVKKRRQARRVRRVRKKIFGDARRPRLAVSRSLRHIYAQIIDDTIGHTLCAASSNSPELRGKLRSGGNVEAARLVGQLLAAKARQLGIEQVCFDRRGRKYHGRIAALAEAAREGGLKF